MTDNEEEQDYYGVAPIRSIAKKMKKQYDKDGKDWRKIGRASCRERV